MSQIPAHKVLFRVVGEEGDVTVETLWATRVGEDQYVLENSPFYAYGVSWLDTVHAPFSPEEGLPTFQAVVEKSGNRTIRIIFDPPVSPGNVSDQVLQGAVSLGCSYEGANPGYVALNIPAEVELGSVSEYLVQNEAQWEYGDPTYESLFPHEA